MSDISSEDRAHAANNNDLESCQNKKDSEKKRREQENFYIEELAMLISHVKDLSDSEDSNGGGDPSRFEKGSILQETVDKLRKLNASQSPQYSQQNFRPAANNLPFRSQFSPPNTINSKQPFQF